MWVTYGAYGAPAGGAWMRVVVIGGSGHVGTYLIPRLVAAGHEVVNVSRGQRDYVWGAQGAHRTRNRGCRLR